MSMISVFKTILLSQKRNTHDRMWLLFFLTGMTSHSVQEARAINPALGVGQEERFFNKLEDDVTQIIQREKRREQYANGQGQEANTSTEHEPVGWLIETHT